MKHIKEISTQDYDGITVEILRLKNGRVITLTDESMSVYKNESDYEDAKQQMSFIF